MPNCVPNTPAPAGKVRLLSLPPAAAKVPPTADKPLFGSSAVDTETCKHIGFDGQSLRQSKLDPPRDPYTGHVKRPGDHRVALFRQMRATRLPVSPPNEYTRTARITPGALLLKIVPNS